MDLKMSKTEIEIDFSQEKPTEKELQQLHQKTREFQQEVTAQLYRQYGNSSPKPIKIVYAMNFYQERIPQVLTCLKRVLPYIDQAIFVYDQTVDQTQDIAAIETELMDYGLAPRTVANIKWVYREWDDHFSKQRNAYLDHVPEGAWVIVSDPDELFSETFLTDMREILLEAEKQGINQLGINSHDITTQLDGTVTTSISDWFKQLIFKFDEGVRYVGCVHETLLPGRFGWRPANLDRRYFYEHIKSMLEIRERGARNVFCGGGGNNVLDKNPMYVEWHKIAERIGITEWPEMRAYIRYGNIDPELKQLFIDHRNDSGWDFQNESRDPFIWYKALFPQEMEGWESTPEPPAEGSPPEVMAYVEEQYKQVLGRHADTAGKENYTDAILRGVIKREELAKYLMCSEEYKQKHPQEAEVKQNE